MNLTLTTNPDAVFSVPIQLLFWGFVAVYVIHILEESVLAENFVDKVRMALAIERTLNGVWHFGETIITRKFSSGLLASTLTWILAYLLVRYSLLKGEIATTDFVTALIIGALITAFMFGTLFATKAVTMKRPAQG